MTALVQQYISQPWEMILKIHMDLHFIDDGRSNLVIEDFQLFTFPSQAILFPCLSRNAIALFQLLNPV